ncbi:MAG: BatD family protein [Candidatus Marinimicrobia bacterium]|nr:BatD family protein [Candidatus Neomarinimicrobiota bacterium]
MRKTGSVPNPSKWLVVFMMILIGQSLAAPRITASIDAKQVLVQESVTLTIEVEGSEVMPQIRLPDINKLALLSGPMQSSNYSYINGKMSSKKSLSYTFVALEPGQVTIPSLKVFLGKQTYQTQTLKLEIVRARRSTSKPVKSQKSVFLKAIPSKYSVYIGEPVSVKYKLFTKVGVYNYQVDKLPDAVGFWAEEIPQASQPRLVSEIIDGVRYNTAVLKHVLYYPTRSGDLLIDPLRTELEIEVQSNQRNRRMFNDPFFNSTRKATKNFLSNPVRIKVKSLPEPRPANFSGAVGKFQIKANLDTNAVFVHDAVGLSITLKGSGNFKSLKLPEPQVPDGVDIFKPERTESIAIRGLKHSGEKRSTYLLVPREPGKVVIDPIEFTYFDLNAQKYITKSSGWIKMTVYDAQGNQPVVTSGYSREEVELMQDDIRYIKAADTKFSKPQAAPFSVSYWSIHVMGILALMGVFGYEYRTRQLQGNTSLRRSVKALTQARKKLKLAQRLSDDSEELRALLHQVIIGYIGARLDIAENAVDTSGLTNLLRDKGLNETIIAETEAFLEGLTMDRFAPGAVQRSASEWIDVTQTLLQDLGRVL